MTDTDIRLSRAADGSYVSRDGRWTVVPVMMGGGALTTRGGDNSGWSIGRREWSLTDTTGQATLSRHGKNNVVVDALWRARDIIAYHERKAASA